MRYDYFMIRTINDGLFDAMMDDYGFLFYLHDMPWGYGFVTSLQVY